MKDRTRARGVALQALYELDVTNHPVGVVLQERASDADLEDALIHFFRSIVLGVLPIREQLDRFISEHAPEWPLDQVAIIDRNILRIAIWEFSLADDIPLKVAINEAVELAKAYGSDSAPRFVNGVLGALADRKNEITQALQSLSSEDQNQSQ
jgi:N utilization substance protein B